MMCANEEKKTNVILLCTIREKTIGNVFNLTKQEKKKKSVGQSVEPFGRTFECILVI